MALFPKLVLDAPNGACGDAAWRFPTRLVQYSVVSGCVRVFDTTLAAILILARRLQVTDVLLRRRRWDVRRLNPGLFDAETLALICALECRLWAMAMMLVARVIACV